MDKPIRPKRPVNGHCTNEERDKYYSDLETFADGMEEYALESEAIIQRVRRNEVSLQEEVENLIKVKSSSALTNEIARLEVELAESHASEVELQEEMVRCDTLLNNALAAGKKLQKDNEAKFCYAINQLNGVVEHNSDGTFSIGKKIG